MARIIIRKGFISHGGRLCKAGEVLTIADDAYAKRMVARSDGDFDFYHGEDDTPTEDEVQADAQEVAAENVDDVSDSDNESDDAGGMPAIDADADVQTAKARGKKK